MKRANQRPAWFLVLFATMLISASSKTSMAADPFQPTSQDRFVPADAKLAAVWCEGSFTEGPVAAADGAILFSDIGPGANRIMRYEPRTGETTEFRRPSGQSNGLFLDSRGRLVACEGANGGGRRISITEPDGTVRTLADRYQGNRFNSPNDLAIDARDRVYFTDPRYVGDEPRELDFEGVFLVLPDGAVHLATDDVQKPNGILVSPDQQTVYLADNNSDPAGNHQLLAFDIADDGRLTGKRVLHDFGPNRRGIDGMTLDAEGNIYATAGSGPRAGVYVFDRTGGPLAFIRTPGDPTNCVFGRGGERNTLYITAGGEDGKYCLYRIRLSGQ